MKASEAMLMGFARTDGRQCGTTYYSGGSMSAPRTVCVLGAINLARCGCAVPAGLHSYDQQDRFSQTFEKAWGIPPQDLNDAGMPWEHLYGMAVAADL
jgi:hypothetical protein